MFDRLPAVLPDPEVGSSCQMRRNSHYRTRQLSSHAAHIQSMPLWRKFRGKQFCLHACKKISKSQWKRTVFLFLLVLAHPRTISAGQHGDIPGTMPASRLDTPPACAPCAALFCREKNPKEICLYTKEIWQQLEKSPKSGNPPSVWERMRERNCARQSQHCYLLAGDKCLCTSDSFPE